MRKARKLILFYKNREFLRVCKRYLIDFLICLGPSFWRLLPVNSCCVCARRVAVFSQGSQNETCDKATAKNCVYMHPIWARLSNFLKNMHILFPYKILTCNVVHYKIHTVQISEKHLKSLVGYAGPGFRDPVMGYPIFQGFSLWSKGG